MQRGTLEVHLVSTKGLKDTDFFRSNPKWNETFLFTITEGVIELHIKLMDKDTFTVDDFVREATIPLGTMFDQEAVPPTSYNVVKDGCYCGEIKVGLNFVSVRTREIDFDEHGGWKQSSAY